MYFLSRPSIFVNYFCVKYMLAVKLEIISGLQHSGMRLIIFAQT